MSSDNAERESRPGGRLFFDPPVDTVTPVEPTAALPQRVAAVAGLDHAELEHATCDDVERILRDLLSALKNQHTDLLEEGDHHVDGGLAIASQVAVWLLDHVSNAFGARLVNLAKVPDRESLRSTRALAVLLHTAISNHRNGTSA